MNHEQQDASSEAQNPQKHPHNSYDASEKKEQGANFQGEDTAYVLAFDTANESIALGLGVLQPRTRTVRVVASHEVAAHRASNTQVLPRVQHMLDAQGVKACQIACLVVGRGPGSFTGVRIALATAKGIASALGVALVGLSSLDAVAWNAQVAGVRGPLAVVADAMRKEVYPAVYSLGNHHIQRLSAERVMKAPLALNELVVFAERAKPHALHITGDALSKYGELFESAGVLLAQPRWIPTGQGLLLALQQAWQADEADPFDARRHHPGLALPIYTRLSDAEENERIRLAKNDPRNLASGVQGALRRDQRPCARDTTVLNARPAEDGLLYKPLDAAHVPAVAALEKQTMGTNAWSENLLLDELPRPDRTWWACYGPGYDEDSNEVVAKRVFSTDATGINSRGAHDIGLDEPAASGHLELLGYAGGRVSDGQMELLKVAVVPRARRRGIARCLLGYLASDARDLGAFSCMLEVRAGNTKAQRLYESLQFVVVGTRSRYYPDGEDALVMQGPLPLMHHDVAGMSLALNQARADSWAKVSHNSRPRTHTEPCKATKEASKGQRLRRATMLEAKRPLILAVETSCDETAAAIVAGDGALVSDVVASQIDFHARFGGVVPEIASRKHVEAIGGVCDECLDEAAAHLQVEGLNWTDLDAVAATYTPGLLGALVVGVAFAKGAAWAAHKPFIGVNHLEGHLYANKIGSPDFSPPAVVSLVSGGNTMLVYMQDWGSYTTLGATIDDAVGEAFDKVAKALGLGYPGGPVLSKEAKDGDANAIAFPRALMHSGDLRFSLSGLKTAVMAYIEKERAARRPLNTANIAASFQQAVVDVQVKKARMALEQTGAPTFCLGGGVAANPALRRAYENLCTQMGVRLVMPPLSACGDNAGMIALVALDRFRQKRFFGWDADAAARTDLDQPY